MAPQSCHETGSSQLASNLTLDLSSTTADERYSEECNDRLKCVLVGDGAVGKTSLVVSYSTNGYPTEYVPTAFDNFSVRINIDGRPVKLQICDTAGQDDFDRLRPLCYPGCDVILVCFSVVRPTSLSNVRHKWVPEMKKHLPKVPIVVVGTQTDLRTSVDVLVDLSRYSERPVTEEEGKDFARQCGASAYIECSALTQKNLKEVFDVVVEQAINFQAREERKRNRSWRKKGASSPVKREQDQWKKLVVKHKTAERWRRFFCLS